MVWFEGPLGPPRPISTLVSGPAVRTAKVRLRIVQAAACPALAELGLSREPGVADSADPADTGLGRKTPDRPDACSMKGEQTRQKPWVQDRAFRSLWNASVGK